MNYALPLVILILGIGFLFILAIFFSQLLKHLSREKVDNEFDYMCHRLERYSNIIVGDVDELDEWKRLYAINVNFRKFILGDNMIYLFDGANKLFAICDKATKKTHMYNLKNALDIFTQFENKFNGCHIKPGDVVISPLRYLHVC